MIRRHLVQKTFTALTVLTSVLISGSTFVQVGTADATQGPAAGLRVTVTPQPTTFSPARAAECEPETGGGAFTCDRYLISVRNEGAAPTDGSPITITDTLPTALTPVGFAEAIGEGNFENIGLPGLSCELSSVTCTYEGALAPGHVIATVLLVKTGSSAEGETLTDSVTVEGGGAPAVQVASPTRVAATPSPFAFQEFTMNPYGADGAIDARAGAHPASLTTSLTLTTALANVYAPSEPPKVLSTILPVGQIGDPQATPGCLEQFVRNEQCPLNTRVGTIDVELSEAGSTAAVEALPLFNVIPQTGYAAEFGFEFSHRDVFLYAEAVHTSRGYQIRVSNPGIPHLEGVFSLTGLYATFWGNPAAHDGSTATIPYLSNPADCGAGQLNASAWATSWPAPDNAVTAEYPVYPNGVSGCNELRFQPAIQSTTTTTLADSPSSLSFDLEIPQNEELEGLATPPLRDITVALPKGLAVNPSSAAGLGACPAEGAEGINLGSTKVTAQGQDLGDPDATELGAGHPGGNSSAYDDGLWHTAPGHCPDASRIGSVELTTPLVDHPLPGKVFLGTPECSPCTNADAAAGKLLKLYIEVNDPQSGVILKLPGTVVADPATGQLTATFSENPQFPLEDLKLHLKSGERATLTTPATCGSYTTTSDLKPWSAPQSGPDATPQARFQVSSGPGGSACAASEAGLANTPSFEAGTTAPLAGAYSPFVLKLGREDGSQRLSAVNVTLPPGLTGKLAGVAQCSDAQLALAAGLSGAAEQASPSCPATSELGSVTVGAGSGSPFYVGGHAYLAGPYEGAPFSVAIVTPAVAGPFDLGTVVVRAGLYIDPTTAQVTIKSDPLPTILAGIPLDIRSVAVTISRPGFMLNPTDCSPASLSGTALSTLGQAASLSSRFQVGACQGLPFKPVLTASTQGRTSKADGASLNVKIASAGVGQASVAKVDLTIPAILPSRLTTIQKACTEALFNANPASCPSASDIGTATVQTPLLNAPLTGPVYFVSHGGAAFPDTEIILQGEGVTLILDGHTQIKKGVTYSRFESVPDAPFTSFEFNAPEGRYSIFGANGNLCQTEIRMPTTIVAQNGAVLNQSTLVQPQGCPNKLTILSHKVKKRTLTLKIAVPGAGRLTATAKHLGTASKTASGRGVVTLSLTAKGRGKLTTKVKLTFSPSHGKKLTAALGAKLKS